MTSGLIKILQLLEENRVEFILVGGMAAVIHGAPVTTFDLDIVHKRTPKNVDRLLKVLKELNANYRGQPGGRILSPTKAALLGSGHNNFKTTNGPLDILCELAKGQGYKELIDYSESVTNGNTTIQIISLKKLIEIKTDLGRAKDKMILPILLKLDEQK